MADGLEYVPRGFHWADYVIFGATILVSSAIGVFFACSGGKQKTTSEYLLGNRNQKIGPVAMSLIVSFESSIMMLGFPAEMYAYGTHYWMLNIGYLFCCVIVSQTFVPLFYPLGLTSSYEYLNLRFKSRGVRLVASVLGIINYLWYMGVVLFGPATALEAVTGFTLEYSVILVTIAAVFYTTIGGIKAVIWSDALQFIIMLTGILAVVIAGNIAVGGPVKVVEYLEKGGRIKFYDFNPDPRTRHTFWNLIVGGSIRSLGMGINQSSVQRITSMKTLKAAKIVMLLTFPGFLIFGTLAYIEGLIAYAFFYDTRCDPLGAGFLSNTNQILPYFVMELFRKQPGLPGLFLASLFSASLSTLSSGFSAMSAVLWSDLLKPCFPKVSEFTATMITKSTVLFLGITSIGIAFIVMQMGGPLNQISSTIWGTISGPLTGLFVIGALFPSATAKGAIWGALSAFAFTAWIAMGSSLSPLAVKTPYLPPAPIDKCYLYSSNTSETAMTSPASWNSSVFSLATEMDLTTAAANNVSELSTGDAILSYIYSLSYMWYGPVSMLLTVSIGLAVSHITGRTPPGTVDPKYIIPIFDRLFCYLPKSVRDNLRYDKDFVPDDDDVEEDPIKKTAHGEFELIVNPKTIPNGVTENSHVAFDKETYLVSEKVTNEN